VRILIVTGIFPPDIGGPATYVPQIAEGLAQRGHAVTVVTLSDHLDHEDGVYPFRVIRLPRRAFRPWRMGRTVLVLLRLGRRADVLFVNGLALESVLANFVLRKPLVMKVVGDLAWERATGRGWTADDFETFQRRRYGLRIELLKALRSWWTRRADRVIVPSRYLARWVVGWGVPAEKIVVIYNAVEPVDGVEPLPVPLKTPIKAVTVGRLIPLKRVDGLLEALKELPDLGLVVVGDGPERLRLERRARELGVSDRVYFAGQRSKKEALGLMAACDLFVLNSAYEGLPHVVLEAMALGLPVVATAAGGTPEVVRDGETGVLVPGRYGTLGASLSALARDPALRRRLGRAARQWIGERLSAENMIRLTEETLFTVAHRSP
jgi:glycosyltransferase involved in cell wall biosynthesis